MIKKVVVVLSVILFVSVLSMEKPVGSKRGLTQLIEAIEQQSKVPRAVSESESELPSSVPERSEPFTAQSQPGLQDLPNELITQISLLITNAKGATNDQKLISAAIDIHNLAKANKAFREFFKSYYIQLNIIKQLAAKYAQGDVYAAAFALATQQASAIIGDQVNSAIGYDEVQASLYEVNKNSLTLFKTNVADSIKRKKHDAWRFFTKYVDPIKLAFIIDSLKIDGTPALVYAIYADDKEMIRNIIAVKDINLNQADELERTPLMAAIATQNTDLIRFLIGHDDVDVDRVDKKGETALLKAVKLGNLEYVNLLLEKDASVDLSGQNEYTLLMVAVSNENVPIVRRLLEVPGIDINRMAYDRVYDQTVSALHIAAMAGDDQIMDLLLSAPGIRLDVQNSDRQTPLHIAAITDNDGLVKRLIQAGAHVNLQDNVGATPLIRAARGDAPLSVYYLVNAPGIDLALTDLMGRTALWHARDANKPGNIAILKSAQAPE